MDFLNKNTLKTRRGFTYTYYTSSAKSDKPTILLLHGWPDEAALWAGLISDYLLPAGYGVIAPDCLGYQGTDKPIDPEAYNLKDQTADMCDILDKESIEQVVPLGHDWGSSFSQRMYIYHPERCIGLINLNVAYRPQSRGSPDLDAMVKLMEAAIGYFPHWYLFLFSDPVEGPQLTGAHIESLFAALHGEPETWLDTLCKKDGIRDWLKEDRTQPVQAYATDDLKKKFVERFSRDGFTAPLMWHRAAMEGYHGVEEAKLPKERFVVNVPYLFVAGNRDVMNLPGEIMVPEKAGLLPKLTKKNVDSGHWSMLSHPKEVGEAVISWLVANF
jgi:pimeloyl-ACP methyl ester carboxylesterase